MNFYKKYNCHVTFNRADIVAKAERALKSRPLRITDAPAQLSSGGKHDYFSMGDYWWPDPDKPNGLPYIRRDGETNPDNFNRHRLLLLELKTTVTALAGGYLLQRKNIYAKKASRLLEEFFIGEDTRMNPALCYAQAIPGRCNGRGVGIIDTLHLIGIPVAADILKRSEGFSKTVYTGLEKWLGTYLRWMYEHEYGRKEMNSSNNHAICWFVQASVFAKFIHDEKMLAFCRNRYKDVLLPGQMGKNGSFPRELARTKPYGYSIFALDNMANLCYILSTKEDNLWDFELPDGRSIRKGMDFIFPYLQDKEKWPHAKDVQHFESWPAQIASLLFFSAATGDEKYAELWKNLPADPEAMEVKRNIAIRQPVIWLQPVTI